MRTIVALSGGLSSAWCAEWALRTHPKEEVVLYFNDTKWEDKDLYRFLNDIEIKLNHKIIIDSDGRSPTELFVDNRALANNRMPFCSRILKAERLQRFFESGDRLVFGIGLDEIIRAHKITYVYQSIYTRTGKLAHLEFPLIKNKVSKQDIIGKIESLGIAIPRLYKLGFEHNNCSGGCVRSGKSQWAHLLRVLPEVYKERENTEEYLRALLGKDIHFLKDITLKQLRTMIQNQYFFDFNDEDRASDCVGICEGAV